VEIAHPEPEITAEVMQLNPGSANLPIGVAQTANREIGVPGLVHLLDAVSNDQAAEHLDVD
jgi:hypothetical protein